MRNDIGYLTGYDSPVDEFLGLGKKDKAFKLQKRAQRQKARVDKEALDNGLIPLDPVTGKPLYAKAGSVDGSGNIKTDDQLNPAPVQASVPSTLSQLPSAGIPQVDNSTSMPMPQFQPGAYNGGAYDAASMMPLTDDLNQTDMNTPQPNNNTMDSVKVSAPAKNNTLYIILAIAAIAAFYFMSKHKV